MSAFLTLDSLSLATPDGSLLTSGLTIAFARERTGIVGRNGAGKSTLLHVMAGETAPAAGTLVRSGAVGLLRQRWPDDHVTAAAALGVADQLARLDRLAAGDGTAEDAAGADWTIEDHIVAALADAGLDPAILPRAIGSLSGGERTRLGIARLSIEAPDLILLDEPTNNLDAIGRDAIMRLIECWRGGVVVVSHDRGLLDAMDRIVELAPTGARLFGGNWSAYAMARDAARDRAAVELDRAQRDLRHVERAVQQQRERKAQRDRAGRAAQRKGTNSKLLLDAEKGRAERTMRRDRDLADRQRDDARAQLDAARARIERLVPLRIELPPTGLPADRRVVRCEGVELIRDGRHLFGPLSFELRGPQRLALVGPNGAGKTSLLAMLRGTLAPSSGTIIAEDACIALLDQHLGMLEGKKSILDNMRRLHPALTDHDARMALARFAFRSLAAERIVDSLSGGERLRAGLACVLSGPHPPQLLLLDEPTNHLDVESIEILEAALAPFDGALIVASHDRRFLGALDLTGEIALIGGSGACNR